MCSAQVAAGRLGERRPATSMGRSADCICNGRVVSLKRFAWVSAGSKATASFASFKPRSINPFRHGS